ncbi:MAG: hypothetical protein JSU07_08815 [Bacteroidetes bacterium]|nr:hypothetical protein [Bacteroidota bacterium]
METNNNKELFLTLYKEFSVVLLFCWHIRSGLNKNITIERIKKYTNWFYKCNLINHFNFEEEQMLPNIDSKNAITVKAKHFHKKLSKLFSDDKNIEKSLSSIEDLLEAYVRFEKQKFLPLIQKSMNETQLNLALTKYPKNILNENWNDSFWAKTENLSI